jgi:hypothetical protein
MTPTRTWLCTVKRNFLERSPIGQERLKFGERDGGFDVLQHICFRPDAFVTVAANKVFTTRTDFDLDRCDLVDLSARNAGDGSVTAP